MALLTNTIRRSVQEMFADLRRPVRLVMFTQEVECEFCAETRQLVEELATLSDKISAEVHDFVQEAELARSYGVDKIPAIVLLGDGQDYGVRFYGIPAGYEFTSLVEAIRLVSSGDPQLKASTMETLKNLDRDVHIQVFVTPTCPYCPQAVYLAHRMAVASPRVRADMVEVTEFPHLAVRYQVMGVPRTVINETVHIEGAAPEPVVLNKLLQAVSENGRGNPGTR